MSTSSKISQEKWHSNRSCLHCHHGNQEIGFTNM